MNTIATATEKTTVVRIGKGLTFHSQAKGVEGAWAACGTVSSNFGAAKHTLGVVSCRKCLDTIAAEKALAAETVEARLTGILAEVAATAPVAEVAEVAAPAEFTKGDIVTTKEGQQATVRRVNANGTIRLVLADGTKVNRKAETLTKA